MGLISRVSSRTYRTEKKIMTFKDNVSTNQSKPIELIDPTFSNKKILEFRDASDDLTCCTYIFYHQDHTLGNALRTIISSYNGVELCGYTIPHPLEKKIHLRIQT